MFEVIEREVIVPNLHLLTLQAPEIVESIQPNLTASNKEDVLRELVSGLVQSGQIP
ncbi:MAG: hypothetical protein GY940_25525, partial [bacterium]|nr:hypothetical protein [bacterium]